MKPAVLIGGALVVVAIVVGVVVLGGGGSDPEPTAVADRPAPATPAQPAAAASAVNDTAATEQFEAWAVDLRAAGFVVTQSGIAREGDAITIAGLDIAGRAGAQSWRWSAASVRVEGIDAERLTVRPTGAQMLTIVSGSATIALEVAAESMELTIDRDANGRAVAFAATVTGGSIGAADATPVTIASLDFRLNLAAGDGLVPAGSTGSIRIEDLVLPAETNGPLGPNVDLLAADLTFDRAVPGLALAETMTAWQGPGDGLTLTGLDLRWGLLELTGAGVLGLDAAGRPAGTFDVAIVDPLGALDAFHAVRRFDRDLMADVYAAILEEMGNNPGVRALPFTIAIADGAIVLSGESRGVGDLVLGTVGPLLPGAP